MTSAASKGDGDRPGENPVQQLAALLRAAKATPRIATERMVRSAHYDPMYRAAVTVLAIQICGSWSDAQWSIKPQHLQLHQFIAIHRGLFAAFSEWLTARREGAQVPLTEWVGFPAGYATDTTHEQVLTYLVSIGELRQSPTAIVLPSRSESYLLGLLKNIESEELFLAEREVLLALKRLKIRLTELQ